MPARVYPSPEHAAFRDLNIFEERLRETAAGLQRRKHRYQLFLAQLLAVIILLLIEVLLPPDISILSIPYKAFLCWLLPEVYANDSVVILHPYFTTGLLFVSVTTLVLFFASGTYSEKIAYANKYVPHTNRALRAFNMFFNTRQPPLRSKFLSNPLSFFFPRPNEITKPISSRSPSPSSPQIESPSTSSTSSTTSTSTSRPRSQSSSRPIHSIPPARNSRGEIIFSRRVSKEYQEGYDRYRATFEKKREEVLRLIKAQKTLERWRWWYKLRSRIPFSSFPPPPTLPPTPTITPTTTPNLPAHPTLGRTASNASSNRGRSGGGGGGGGGGSSRSGTPPTPGSSKSATPTDRSGSPMRQSRSSTKRSPNRRTPSNNNTSNSSSNSRRDGGEGEGDMRMQALSRSLAQGSLASSS